jgi:hypothetical protein
MHFQAFQHARLMQESQLRVEMTPHLHTPTDSIASRVLESKDAYRRWEHEHDRLMRVVSRRLDFDGQVGALRHTAFSLVHRRALFQYLRERQQLNGNKRRRLLAIFYGCLDYTNAIITEHWNFIRCSSSYLCTQHLGEHLMHDAAFDEPLQLYELWYTEYFRAYCDCELDESEEERHGKIGLNELRPLLKYRVAEARNAILAMPHNPEKEWRELEIRKPNGDTQRLRTLFGDH